MDGNVKKGNGFKRKNRLKHCVTQAIIHTKLEEDLLDKVHKFEKPWNPWVVHYLPPGFDES